MVVIFFGGYVIFRIWVINFGVWFVYCYWSFYFVFGMNVMLNVLFEN